MRSGEIHAWHYATRRPVRARWRPTGIFALEEVSEAPQQDLWLAPPLFDLQINGYLGTDFQRDGPTLRHAAAGLMRDGCAKFFFTLITDEWSRIMTRLESARKKRASVMKLRQMIAGWHIEGPFLSEKPGFCGAHNPAWMRDPTEAHLRELRAVTGDDPVLLTIAPERRGAIEAIRVARKLGFTVSLGHTDASAEVLRAAVEAGATAFTHLGNGCPRELDRHDNILWRVLEEPRLAVSLIPDGTHVSPPLFRLLHRTLEGRLVYYTTDAMAAAGAPPGRYTIGELEVEVGNDQIVKLPGKTNFAGSALTPVAGVFRAARMLKVPWQECWKRFSENPARLVGMENTLDIGSKPFCIVNPARESATLHLL